jgi:hypothetical protein
MAQDLEAQELAICECILEAVRKHMKQYLDNGSIAKLDCSITRGLEGLPSGVAATWVYTPTWVCPKERTGYWWIDKSGRTYEAGRHTSKFNVLTDTETE